MTLGPGPVPDRIRRAKIKFGSLRLLMAFVLIDEFLSEVKIAFIIARKEIM